MSTETNESTEQATGNVLVVDDDEGVRKLLVRWVSDMGYTVRAASDADAALDVIREWPVDVALCDVRMPGRDGIWLTNEIRRMFPQVAVVLATGLVEMDPMVTLQPGVVGYIVKPFSREDVQQVVQCGMSERRRLQGRKPSALKLLSEAALEGFMVESR
jgi:CheY-like chemotaxis protein